MKSKFVCGYEADAGSCVINGIGIGNTVGDGGFDVYYVDTLPKNMKVIKELWIDLRNGYPITIHGYDCNKCGAEFEPNKVIKPSEFREYFGNAQALQIAVDSGNIYFVKYF